MYVIIRNKPNIYDLKKNYALRDHEGWSGEGGPREDAFEKRWV